ncbi:hypothetical protein RD792_005649 [Penstemon davidsonii]|uniref:Polygalacturonase n=1 Tax=Penstemon davidsonii TaxID=160366 RepID=A0ABR0DFR8_9LAMI|nr:hypothetical protein RD792_005649 [Penstemon davidsonii]
MALGKKYFFLFIIIITGLCSCVCSLHNDNLPDDYIQEESGYDYRAFPWYFSPIIHQEEDENNNNNSTNFKKMRKVAASVNVLNFGAKGDGSTDDSKAFQDAWKEACSTTTDVNFVIPHNKSYLLKPVRFPGPCNSHITIQIAGTIVASDDRSDYSEDERHWLIFDSVENLVVQGGGTINGNGNIWWQNSCKINKNNPCKNAPTALTFYKCTNLVVKNLKIENAQQIHLSFERCSDVEASNLLVRAPEKSPNTDGIHVTRTQNIQISTCTIGTGDDCISIVSGSEKVRATGIICGPGHGISIGSLGSGNSEAYVSDVVVNGAKLSGTTNGVRIKTWQGGSGNASNIRFQNIEMQNVENPIIIDQNYCDQDEPCKEQGSNVQVKNVVYQNIKGTSASDVAIDFDCSKSHPCQGIVLQNVNLVEENGGKAEVVCKNVDLQSSGTVSPSCP